MGENKISLNYIFLIDYSIIYQIFVIGCLEFRVCLFWVIRYQKHINQKQFEQSVDKQI